MWEEGVFLLHGGLSSHANLATPPSPDCASTKDNATAWWGKNAGEGTGYPPQSPAAPRPWLVGGQIPLCEGLGTELSSTLIFLSDFALFW